MADPAPAGDYVVPDAAGIGHVHLKVADLDRALAFWHGVLGFRLTGRIGDQAAFLAAGGYHHHIGLNTWHSAGGAPPPAGTTGLYHVAIRYPGPEELAGAVRRVLAAGVAVTGAFDHGANVAVYLADPDGNGVELNYDRPVDAWPRDEAGRLRLLNQRIDVRQVAAAEA